MSFFRPLLACLGLLSLVTGLAYPLVVTGLAQLAFPHRANGSLITINGCVAGSALIGQATADPRYFWSRPSATTDADGRPLPTHGGRSAGSNLAPSNPDLRRAVELRIAALRAEDPGNQAPVPVDLVSASGSGLDPHISPAAAEFQVGRVARLRGLDPARVRALVRAHTEGRTFGLLGEPRVAVLPLNLALDGLK